MDDVTAALVRQLERSHGVKPTGTAEVLGVNGIQARSVMMESASPFPSASGQQQLERDWLVVMPPSANRVIFFVFIAPQSDFARFQPTYQALLQTLQY